MTTKKKKTTTKSLKPPRLSDALLKAGLDPDFWYIHPTYRDSAGNGIDEYKIIALTKIPINLTTLCAICGIKYDNGVPSCLCVRHQCGHSFIKGTNRFGRCAKQEHCARCCKCVQCIGCMKLFTNNKLKYFAKSIYNAKICTSCMNCCDCCKCAKCTVCNEKVFTPNTVCACPESLTKAHHAKCCESEQRLNVHHTSPLFIHRTPHFFEGSNFQRVRTRRFMSVETEILDVSKAANFLTFNKEMKRVRAAVVPEGTVPTGFEINSAPASGDAFLQSTTAIVAAITAVGGNINVRCGTHVHVDARDLHYVDLVNLLHLYNKIEPAIFAMLPPFRRVSRFCTPCRKRLLDIAKHGEKLVSAVRDPELAAHLTKAGEQTKIKPAVAQAIAERMYRRRTLYGTKIHKNGDNQRLRYMALNLHSWVYQRTIEFRHWPGSVDLQELLLWPQVCATIIDASKRMTIEAIEQLPSNPVKALLTILEPGSKVSRSLRSFVESKIQQWSSDFNVWWPIVDASNTETVVPFKEPTRNGQVVSFDMTNNAFTYIPSSYKGAWSHEWDNPYAIDGAYAELKDCHIIPRGKLLWMKPNDPSHKPATPAFRLENRVPVDDLIIDDPPLEEDFEMDEDREREPSF